MNKIKRKFSIYNPSGIGNSLSLVACCFICASLASCGRDQSDSGSNPTSSDETLGKVFIQKALTDIQAIQSPAEPKEKSSLAATRYELPLALLAGGGESAPVPKAVPVMQAPNDTETTDQDPPSSPSVECLTQPEPTVAMRLPAPPDSQLAQTSPREPALLTSAEAAPPALEESEGLLSGAVPVATGTPPLSAAPLDPVANDLILDAVRRLPRGGGYAVNRTALNRLRSSIMDKKGRLELESVRAQPSFCSGATYLVFLDAIAAWHQQRQLRLPDDQVRLLLVIGQPDGEGVWGRWNANGPGTARLFTELGIGVNFQSFEHAQPGDFLKIWWNEHIGRREAGHSVIFLGYADTGDGEKGVRFWSSNQPEGYGEKVVPFSKIKRALFSRLTHPGEIAVNLPMLAKKDAFLTEMLTRDCSERELAERTGMTPRSQVLEISTLEVGSVPEPH